MDSRFLTLNGRVSLAENLAGVTSTAITAATYSISDVENVLFADTTSNAITIKAPNPATRGRSFRVHKTSTDANSVSIAQYGTEKIGGTAATYVCPGSTTAAKRSWEFISDGTDWRLANNVPAVDGNTWTPTLFPRTNADASSGGACFWVRVGDYVHCTGMVVVDPTASGSVSIGISLPVASNLAVSGDLSGICNSASFSGVIIADTVNDQALLTISTNTVTTPYNTYIHFSYVVK